MPLRSFLCLPDWRYGWFGVHGRYLFLTQLEPWVIKLRVGHLLFRGVSPDKVAPGAPVQFPASILRRLKYLAGPIIIPILTAMQLKLTVGDMARHNLGTNNLEAYLKVVEGADCNGGWATITC